MLRKENWLFRSLALVALAALSAVAMGQKAPVDLNGSYRAPSSGPLNPTVRSASGVAAAATTPIDFSGGNVFERGGVNAVPENALNGSFTPFNDTTKKPSSLTLAYALDFSFQADVQVSGNWKPFQWGQGIGNVPPFATGDTFGVGWVNSLNTFGVQIVKNMGGQYVARISSVRYPSGSLGVLETNGTPATFPLGTTRIRVAGAMNSLGYLSATAMALDGPAANIVYPLGTTNGTNLDTNTPWTIDFANVGYIAGFETMEHVASTASATVSNFETDAVQNGLYITTDDPYVRSSDASIAYRLGQANLLQPVTGYQAFMASGPGQTFLSAAYVGPYSTFQPPVVTSALNASAAHPTPNQLDTTVLTMLFAPGGTETASGVSFRPNTFTQTNLFGGPPPTFSDIPATTVNSNTVLIDNTAPTVAVPVLSGSAWNSPQVVAGTLTITVDAADLGAQQSGLDGRPAGTITWSDSSTTAVDTYSLVGNSFQADVPVSPTTPNGNATLSLQVCDRAGNCTTRTVVLQVHTHNDPPVLDFIGDKVVDELTLLTFTLTSSDPDGGAPLYTYSGNATGLSVNPTTGVVTWTPTEAQGPGTYSATFTVDDGNGGLDSETITITVNEVNAPPVLTVATSHTIPEMVPYTFNASASDPDIPANTLTFSLVGAPAGMTINPSTGQIDWTPTEAQGPGSYTFDVVVTDDGSPNLSDTETVTVNVQEVNLPPVLTVATSHTIPEMVPYTFNASASDPDVPANTLTFSLVGAPAGMTINPSTGQIDWTPTEAQGPGSYTFDVVVTDDGSPNLSDTKTVTVNVQEVNLPPVLTVATSHTIPEMVPYTFNASASDPDVPANTLTFSLVGAPAGMTINPSSGQIDWTPTEAQGPGSYTFDVVVTDDGSPNLSDTETVTVNVQEVNLPPVLTVATSHSVNELSLLSFTASATDPDIPANTLTFSLVGAPSGMTINPSTGQIDWTPTEAQGPGSYTFDVVVTDDGSPNLSDTETVTVNVNEVNIAPTADSQTLNTNEDTPINVTLTASDPDIPANTLTWTIVTPPANGSLSGTAPNLTYTPSPNYFGTDTFTFKVNDGTADSNIATVTINVASINDAPVLTVPGPQTVSTCQVLNLTGISVNDVDVFGLQLTMNLNVANGKLTLSSVAGLTFFIGDGTDDSTMVFAGTQAAINAALSSVTYNPNPSYIGPDTLNVAVSDNGNSGAGGPLLDSDSVAITVQAATDEEILPTSYTATIGEDADGDLSALFTSDDVYVSLFNDSLSLTAELVFDGQASMTTGCELRFTIETAVDRGGLAQRVYIYNWLTSSWVLMNGGTAPGIDTTITVSTTNLDATIRNDGAVRAKVNWSPINDEDPSQDGWQHRVDVAKWNLIR